jgi:hypothetical protein
VSEKRLPDTAALMRLATRLRTDSEALMVIVIRVNDVAFSVDPGVSPRDAGETIEAELPSLVQHLAESRGKGNHAPEGK